LRDAVAGEGGMSRRLVVWLIPILLTLHNAEEAIAFSRMRPRLRALLPQPFAAFDTRLSDAALLQALAGLSVAAFILAAFVTLRPQSKAALWLLLAVEAAVALNVVAHLVSAAAIFHGYGPGLATAVLLNAPFAVYVLRRAKREAWVSVNAWNALGPAAVILHGPVLFGALWLAGR
jgi:hypothetical protein